MGVDKQIRVATLKVYAFVKLHCRIAVRVYRQDALVKGFRLAETLCLAHEVAEEGEHAGIVVKNEALGVPLYAHNALEVRTFYGFNYPVGSSCRYAEQGTGGSYRLVVERIYGNTCAERFAYDAIG
jgi:hypothetical protein